MSALTIQYFSLSQHRPSFSFLNNLELFTQLNSDLPQSSSSPRDNACFTLFTVTWTTGFPLNIPLDIYCQSRVSKMGFNLRKTPRAQPSSFSQDTTKVRKPSICCKRQILILVSRTTSQRRTASWFALLNQSSLVQSRCIGSHEKRNRYGHIL